MSSASVQIWVLSNDLLLTSRIREGASALDLPCSTITAANIGEILGGPGILFVDLDVGVDLALGIIAQVKHSATQVHICGYGSHVEFDDLRRMKDAGADRVVARSNLARGLNEILRESIQAIGRQSS